MTKLALIILLFTGLGLTTFIDTGTSSDGATESLGAINYSQQDIYFDGEKLLEVQVADTNDLRRLGLSGRQGLNDNEGLLFVLDDPSENGIWMKDMNFGIDIIWLDTDKKIVHLVENASPESFPSIFQSPIETPYILETNVDFVNKTNLKIGDRLTFQ